jgi:hypothetical protein
LHPSSVPRTQASRMQALGGAHNDLVAFFREHPNE